MAYDPNDPNPEELPSFQWPPQSHHAKELRKWDMPKSRGGMRPDSFQMFPKMMYMARKRANGQWATSEPEPPSFGYEKDTDWNRACQAAAHFTESCHRTVQNEREYDQARGQGWRDTPDEAMAYREALDNEIDRAAAHRAYEDRNMSERAKAEAKVVEDSTPDQVPEIPEKPRASQKRLDALAKARAAKAAKKVTAA